MGFDAFFQEHKSTKSIRVFYTVIGITYNVLRLFFYHFLVIVLGFIFALCFALVNASLVFLHVWLVGPIIKIFIMWVYVVAPTFFVPVRAVYQPLVDTSARLFSQIKINTTSENVTVQAAPQRQPV